MTRSPMVERTPLEPHHDAWVLLHFDVPQSCAMMRAMNSRGRKHSRPSDVLTWEEILARYPEQWVVLVNVDWGHREGELRSALVLAHGKNRDETLRRSDPIRAGYREFAHRYTGRVRAPFLSVNLPLL